MKTKTIISVLLLAVSTAAYAGTPDGTAMSFAVIPHTAETLSSGASSMSSFMASVPMSSETLSASAFWQSWSPSYVSETFMGASASLKAGENLGVRVSGVYGVNPEYDVYTDAGVANGKFAPVDLQIGVGAAYKLLPFLSVGAEAKMLKSTLTGTDSYSAMALDISALADFNVVRVAAGMNNAGGKVKSKMGSAFSLPSSLFAAAASSMTFADKHEVSASMQLDYYLSGAVAAGAGCRYEWNHMASLCAGYHFGAEGAPLPSFFSAGIGCCIAGVKFGATYLMASETLAGSMLMSVGYAF